DPRVAPEDPAEFPQPLQEGADTGLRFRVVRGQVHEHPDSPHAIGLLRACRERPRCGRAADKRDELAPLHSITSSARASSVAGTSIPSALAVLRLMTSSKRIGCTTGSSAGLTPLRILPM